MSLDANFINALLHQNDLQIVFNNKIEAKFLLSPYNNVFQMITEHFTKYGTVPGVETVLKQFPTIEISAPKDSLLYFCDELKNREKFNSAQLLAKQIFDAFKTADSPQKKKDALVTVQEAVFKLSAKYALDLSTATTQDITSSALMRYADYQARKNNAGVLGIPVPWTPLQDETMGWQKGDMITFLGKSGLGKTWALMLCAAHAHANGAKVLVFTHEMTIKQLGFRFDALMSGIAHDSLKKTSLNPLEEEHYRVFLETMEEQRKSGAVQPFIINQGSPADGGTTISAVIRSIRPDIVIIDGAYLFAESYSWDKVSELTKSIKMAAILNEVPIIVSNQYAMNKMSQTKSAFSASFINDSNIVIKMIKEEEKKFLPVMGFQLMKGRDISTPDMAWMADWDFEEMKFGYRPDLHLDEIIFDV
jgi:replicative DNA helicase